MTVGKTSLGLNKTLRLLVCAITAGGFLAGCGATDQVKELFADPIVFPCPDDRVLADAAELVRYAEGQGRDLTDVDSEAQIARMELACLTRIDKKTRVGEMEIEIAFNFIATRGPANRSRKATFPYFISVTDLDKKILYREEFEVGVDFSGNRTRLAFKNEPITITLPLRPELTSKNYLIYGGFLPNREQLEQNRQRRQQIGS